MENKTKFINFFEVLQEKAPQSDVSEITEHFSQVCQGATSGFTQKMKQKTVYWFNVLCEGISEEVSQKIAYDEQEAMKYKKEKRSGWHTPQCAAYLNYLHTTLKQSYILYIKPKKTL